MKARPRNEKEYQLRLEVEKEIRKAKGDSYRITPQNVKYKIVDWIYGQIIGIPGNVRGGGPCQSL